jgi:hypothetical protein
MATIEFQPEPVVAVAKRLSDGTWFVRCQCASGCSWGWETLPEEAVVPCPCDECPFDVRVVPYLEGQRDG